MQNNNFKIQKKAINAVIQQLPGSNKKALNKAISEFFDLNTFDGYERTINYLLSTYLHSDEESSSHVANTVTEVMMIISLLRKLSDVNIVNDLRTEGISCL